MAYPFDRKLRLGSNNWAVSSALSVSGKAILSGDPHQKGQVDAFMSGID